MIDMMGLRLRSMNTTAIKLAKKLAEDDSTSDIDWWGSGGDLRDNEEHQSITNDKSDDA
jgi:hypothetical protein